MERVTLVRGDQFEQEVAQATIPVLVEFFASWCAPCKALRPVLERLAEEFAGQARVVQVDIDAEPELAERFEVESVPTLLVFRGGRIVEQLAGAPPHHQLRELLRGYINPKSAAAILNAPWLK